MTAVVPPNMHGTAAFAPCSQMASLSRVSSIGLMLRPEHTLSPWIQASPVEVASRKWRRGSARSWLSPRRARAN